MQEKEDNMGKINIGADVRPYSQLEKMAVAERLHTVGTVLPIRPPVHAQGPKCMHGSSRDNLKRGFFFNTHHVIL
jgi:hypothetical protein